MSAISGLTISGPDVAELVAALQRITGGAGVAWHPAVTAAGEEGRTCIVPVGADVVEVFEVPRPVALPESITVTVDDPSGAADRLRNNGFEVVEHEDLPVAATVSVGGVCIRLVRENHHD